MIVLTVANVKIPDWIASITQPLSGANALVSMLMVGMLMDLPQSKHDVKEVMAVIAWRIPFSVAFALIAWLLLPFSASIRAVMVICALAPDRHFLHAVHRQSTRQRQTGRLLAGNHRDDFTGDDGCGSRADGRVSKMRK